MGDQYGVRYYRGQKDIGEARRFSWEYPVPDNDFWHDLPYSLSRNFLQSFSSEKLKRLSDCFDDGLCRLSKLELLAELLHKELKEQEDAAASNDSGQTFYDVEYTRWRAVCLAIASVQSELGQRAVAEDTLRKLHEKRRDPADLSHLHSLAGLLLAGGAYSETEKMVTDVQAWLDGCLGRDSPQALSARRVLAEAMWKQGLSRRNEAWNVLLEMRVITNEMGTGQYAVYQDEEKEMMDKLILSLLQDQQQEESTVE
ncbi:hypothetical protein LY78DRAFT_472977 [Colletotrichum sublineola]|uniref:Uncharacterized protein n=1 Tax=Colletotrichum sublineola TaxID=1173701 RepID=A0A066XCU6_COLSU|nr:hypothetical protein LY78DRAFT_472977 [Colletotrichum sublineola]KDN65474.1 hypothetical protein CSUB01_05520 [Colletotrichum sublineola]